MQYSALNYTFLVDWQSIYSERNLSHYIRVTTHSVPFIGGFNYSHYHYLFYHQHQHHHHYHLHLTLIKIVIINAIILTCIISYDNIVITRYHVHFMIWTNWHIFYVNIFLKIGVCLGKIYACILETRVLMRYNNHVLIYMVFVISYFKIIDASEDDDFRRIVNLNMRLISFNKNFACSTHPQVDTPNIPRKPV